MRVKETSGIQALRSLVVALAFVVLAAPAVALADGRVALVVGNSTYAHIGRQPNPENDAADMSAALRRLGFEVTTEFDADPGGADRGAASVHAPKCGGGRLAGLLRGPRHRDGLRQLLGPGGRASGAHYRCSGLVVCRACLAAWRCESSAQPDGGEVLAKRKGAAARRGLEEA